MRGIETPSQESLLEPQSPLRSGLLYLLEEGPDRALVIVYALIWTAYSYIPDFPVFRYAVAQEMSESFFLMWVPGTMILVYFTLRVGVLRFRTVHSITTYIAVGLGTYAIQTLIDGFSMIGFFWFCFYYCALGALLSGRGRLREVVQLLARGEADLGICSPEAMIEMKRHWRLLVARCVMVLVAFAAVLGVSMAPPQIDVYGGLHPVWRNWVHTQVAARVVFVYIGVFLTHALFFFAPALELFGHFREMLRRKDEQQRQASGTIAEEGES